MNTIRCLFSLSFYIEKQRIFIVCVCVFFIVVIIQSMMHPDGETVLWNEVVLTYYDNVHFMASSSFFPQAFAFSGEDLNWNAKLEIQV